MGLLRELEGRRVYLDTNVLTVADGVAFSGIPCKTHPGEMGVQ